MKIETQFSRLNTPLKRQKADGNTLGAFQTAFVARMSTRRTEDTISIFSQKAVPEDSTIQSSSQSLEAAEDTPPALDILPSDSTEIKLEKLREIAEQADYTGMSYSEIYTTIWNRYNDAFGGNMAAYAINATPDGCLIEYQFQEESNALVLYPLEKDIATQTGLSKDDPAFGEYVQTQFFEIRSAPLGYDGMTTDEKETAIFKKYAGRDTVMDFLNMQGELHDTGVLCKKMGFDGSFQYLMFLDTQIKQTNFPDNYYSTQSKPITQAQYDTLAHTKFEANAFFVEMKASVASCSFDGFDFDVEQVLSKGIDDMLDMLAER
jgi:hypothetical protein